MSDYISREDALDCTTGYVPETVEEYAARTIRRIKNLPAANALPVPQSGIGDLSDGYHTFNQLYYQRMMLFAALVRAYKGQAWKALRHEDGELCFGGGWFIVGLDTPEGSYTYHYEEKYFDLFDCDELPVAKHWDGHTEEDVTRLISLPEVRPVVRGHWILDSDPGEPWKHRCDQCGGTTTDTCMGEPIANWCPLCGAYMGEEGETLRTQQQLRKRKYVSRDRVFIEFADWANETGATNTQNFSDRLRAIPTVDVSEDTKDV